MLCVLNSRKYNFEEEQCLTLYNTRRLKANVNASLNKKQVVGKS